MLRSRDQPSPRALIAGAALAVAIGLSAATQARKTRRLDHAVRRRVKPKRNPRVEMAAKWISSLASPAIHPLAALAASVGVSVAKQRLSLAPLVASVSSTVIDKSVKSLVTQRRPPRSTKHKGRERFAFPSGHTAAMTAIAFATATELADGRSDRERAFLYTLAGALAAAVGWSRLQLDEHWFDDVAGGWAAGFAIAVSSNAVADSKSWRHLDW